MFCWNNFWKIFFNLTPTKCSLSGNTDMKKKVRWSRIVMRYTGHAWQGHDNHDMTNYHLWHRPGWRHTHCVTIICCSAINLEKIFTPIFMFIRSSFSWPWSPPGGNETMSTQLGTVCQWPQLPPRQVPPHAVLAHETSVALEPHVILQLGQFPRHGQVQEVGDGQI